MSYTYATAPSNVVTDSQGNVVSNFRIYLYDARVGGSTVTNIKALDGSTLPGYLTTDSNGRYEFQRTIEDIAVLWADDGQSSQRWSIVANESTTAASQAQQDAANAAASAQAAEDSAATAAQKADAASGANAVAQSALDEIETYKTQTPNIEQLITTLRVGNWTTSNGNLHGQCTSAIVITLLVVPFPLNITSVSLSWDYWNMTANDTNYWSVEVIRYSENFSGSQTLGTRTTQATGSNANGGVTARTAWTFGGVDFSNTTFNTGDLISMELSPNGSVARMLLGLAVTIGYAPA